MTTSAQWSFADDRTSCVLTNGGAQWAADFDTRLGGSGALPTPHDLLDSSLAACTALTLEIYIKRKKLPVESVRVDVERQETAEGYRLQRKVFLVGGLSESQQRDVVRAAENCPVHKVLRGAIETSTEFVGNEAGATPE